MSLAHVDSTVIDLRVGNNKHSMAFVDATGELAVQFEPASGQRSIRNDVSSRTIDADGLADFNDFQQVGGDGDSNLWFGDWGERRRSLIVSC